MHFKSATCNRMEACNQSEHRIGSRPRFRQTPGIEAPSSGAACGQTREACDATVLLAHTCPAR